MLAGPTAIPNIRINIALQVARGMSYLHLKDIVHLDIKPGNVLLRRPVQNLASVDDLHIQICDFGLARKVTTEIEVTVLCTVLEYNAVCVCVCVCVYPWVVLLTASSPPPPLLFHPSSFFSALRKAAAYRAAEVGSNRDVGNHASAGGGAGGGGRGNRGVDTFVDSSGAKDEDVMAMQSAQHRVAMYAKNNRKWATSGSPQRVLTQTTQEYLKSSEEAGGVTVVYAPPEVLSNPKGHLAPERPHEWDVYVQIP